MQSQQLCILSDADELQRLCDLARRFARILADRIDNYDHIAQPSEELTENHGTAYRMATAIFKDLGQISINGSVLYGAERLYTIQPAFEWLQIMADDWSYEFWLRDELGNAVQHIGAFLHAVELFTEVDRSVKATAPPAESGDQQADATTWDRTMSPIAIEKDGSVTVLGKSKSVTPAQFVAIETLVAVYPDSMVKDSLEAKGGTAARRTLKKLSDTDPDFAKVISFPGQTGQGRGYRLIWPESP